MYNQCIVSMYWNTFHISLRNSQFEAYYDKQYCSTVFGAEILKSKFCMKLGDQSTLIDHVTLICSAQANFVLITLVFVCKP